MSVKLMGMAFDLDLNSRDKFVLIALADHADHNGNHAYPSVGTLAKKTSMDERTVQRALRRLETTGLIRQEKPATQHFPTWYQITLPRGDTQSPLMEDQGRHRVTSEHPGVTLVHPRGDCTPPEPSLTVLRTQPSLGSRATSSPNGRVQTSLNTVPSASPPHPTGRFIEIVGKGRCGRHERDGLRNLVAQYGEERVLCALNRSPGAIAESFRPIKELEKHLRKDHPDADLQKARKIAEVQAAYEAHPIVPKPWEDGQ